MGIWAYYTHATMAVYYLPLPTLPPTQITNAQILPNFFKPPQQYIHTLHNYTKLIAQTLPQIFRNLEKFQFYKYKKFSKKN